MPRWLFALFFAFLSVVSGDLVLDDFSMPAEPQQLAVDGFISLENELPATSAFDLNVPGGTRRLLLQPVEDVVVTPETLSLTAGAGNLVFQSSLEGVIAGAAVYDASNDSDATTIDDEEGLGGADLVGRFYNAFALDFNEMSQGNTTISIAVFSQQNTNISAGVFERMEGSNTAVLAFNDLQQVGDFPADLSHVGALSLSLVASAPDRVNISRFYVTNACENTCRPSRIIVADCSCLDLSEAVVMPFEPVVKKGNVSGENGTYTLAPGELGLKARFVFKEDGLAGSVSPVLHFDLTKEIAASREYRVAVKNFATLEDDVFSIPDDGQKNYALSSDHITDAGKVVVKVIVRASKVVNTEAELSLSLSYKFLP